ncbi:hypothetical protein [Streptomyces noursei]|uniref:hypothetical protein n=1 Tax=Streptomyces noursei TaxID=1971 RepID=UPI0016765520|nr:hypothetical protein [Streptomyces noursei]MCZ1012943.1 hypothetical protein [Streptomyces noursei]GGX21230.1 hypothetical protein GCM10010341_48250 [Streptomyces noursei]
MTSSHRTATRRRNLVRTSAIAAVAGSALLLPAAAAFADSPAPANPASPNAEQDQKQDGNQNQEKGTPDKDAQDKSGQEGSSQEKDKGSQGKDKGSQDKGKDKKGERSFVRAQNLAGGFTAKIYKLGQNHYQADMYAKAPDTGKLVKYDTLETTGGKPAYGQHNGAHFVLQPDGTMASWVEGGNKKPDNKDGKGKDGKSKKQDPGKATPKNQGKVIPKGGVKAGAEGVESGDHTMLLAGGGAATAAAGLGFAALHRRKAGRSGDNA